ncbi:putative cysteine repeat modular protein [Gregarina niphandrodes]|uniref:Cysteine repeat modular protein n=1 Tax=Gregarina niphandrodes TaxID=110365 RepID=A0A023BD56_GRENI|nr:putative cysteine repeat modular protein [Gregarina niphandrodes]EZG86250.1 putative cysteine repeat modular protein [Gregarina niphandrodes]|eukprot:XP_011128770.1 putative cysteine repeat modular protein [Gregarina niphandrodes]
MSCPTGYAGPECAYCDEGYWVDRSALKGEQCHRCPGSVALYMALALVVSTLFCLSLAVLNVKAGANRKSIHSLVLKLMIAFVADLQTYTTYLTTTLLHYVNLGGGSDSSSTPSGVRIQDLYDLGFLQCLSKSDTFAERYRDGMLFFNAVPLLSGLFVTFIAASVVGLSIPLHANSIRKRRRLYEMLIQKNLIDAAAKLGREIDNTRTLSVWRYTTARPIPVAAHVIRFFRDMVPPYIVIGVTYYNILLRRQTDLLACTRDAEGVLRNASVTGIKCAWDDSNYVVYFSFGLVFMFFWGLGLPVVFLCLLLPHSNQLNSPQILQKYGFLHNGYDLRYWYWEIFFFARKAAINISLIISHNDSNYMKFALFISLMFFTIHVWISPFDRRNNNIMSWLDIGCLACWIVSLTLACFGEALDTEGSNVIGLVIIFINVIFARTPAHSRTVPTYATYT